MTQAGAPPALRSPVRAPVASRREVLEGLRRPTAAVRDLPWTPGLLALFGLVCLEGLSLGEACRRLGRDEEWGRRAWAVLEGWTRALA